MSFHAVPRSLLPTRALHRRFASATAIAFVLAALPLAAPAHEANLDGASRKAAAQADNRATQLTNGLLMAMKALERAPAADRAMRARDVLTLASERRQAMLALLETDPRRVMTLAMPAALRERLPQEARALVEQPARLEGTVASLAIDDHQRGVSRHAYFLDVDAAGNRSRFGLHWADANMTERDELALIGKRVRVDALRIDGQLVVGDRRQVELAAAGGSTSTSSGTSSGSTEKMAAVSGDQRTLVILTNFSDQTVGCSTSDVQNRVFGASGSVNDLYRQSSRDLVSFSGDVVGPFTIPYSSGGSCAFDNWGAAADAAAKAAGIDPSRYARVSYALPSSGTCGWSGIAYVGGSRSWVASCGSTGLFAHELGHNLMFKHASTPGSTYGDASDPMGNAPRVQLHGPNRVMAGWLGSGNVVDASSGTYSIAALETAESGGPQVIRLPKRDTSEFYYVSLRQAIDLDAGLSSSYRDVLSVHYATGTMPSVTVLTALLAPGQSYTDSTNGIRITAQSVASGTATMSIETTGPTCTRSAPALSVSPGSKSGAPGATLGYSVSVTNRNSSGCSSSVFAFGQALPAGFNGAFSPSSVSLAPGASATVTWNVGSSTASGDGVYGIQAGAAEAGSTGASAAASYVVYADGSAPTVSVDWPSDGAILAAKPMSLSASAYDDGGIARVEFLVNGQLIGSSTAAPYQVRWNPKKAKGQQTITARAFDNAGNSSEATVRVTLK